MIEASYTQTFRDLLDGTTVQVRVRMFRLPRRILGFALLVFWLAGVVQGKAAGAGFLFYLLPVVAVLLAFGHHILAFIGAMSARKLVEGKTFTFEFTAEHYRFRLPGTEATVAWSNVIGGFGCQGWLLDLS